MLQAPSNELIEIIVFVHDSLKLSDYVKLVHYYLLLESPIFFKRPLTRSFISF